MIDLYVVVFSFPGMAWCDKAGGRTQLDHHLLLLLLLLLLYYICVTSEARRTARGHHPLNKNKEVT